MERINDTEMSAEQAYFQRYANEFSHSARQALYSLEELEAWAQPAVPQHSACEPGLEVERQSAA